MIRKYNFGGDRWLRSGLLFIYLCVLFPSVALSENFQTSRRLAEFVPHTGDIYLRTAEGNYDLYFPLPQRIEVDELELELHFTNSIALEKPRSVFRLRLNEHTVTQFYLDKHNPQSSIRVKLPKHALKVGFNRIGFDVTQHYARSQEDQHVCEDGSAPELWTQVDTWRSQLHLQANYRSFPMTLADLNVLFDRRAWQDQPLVIMALESAVNEDLLQWGNLLSQAVGLRIDYRPVQVKFAPLVLSESQRGTDIEQRYPSQLARHLNQSDGILIGTKDQVAPYLKDGQHLEITGPYLGLFPVDKDSLRYMLVISGQNANEVTTAVRTLLNRNLPFPNNREMLVSDAQFDSTEVWAEPYLDSEREYKFSDLGFKTVSLRGTYVQAELVNFRLPADMRALESADVKLLLNLAYGASVREDSVLNIYVNDVFERAIPLNNVEGAAIRNYQINIPARSFQPGLNRISLEPRLIPMITNECLLEHDENLHLAIFDDSRIQIPRYTHYVEMPDLALLARTGFPHVQNTDSVNGTIQVTDLSAHTLGAAWTLAAKLAQVSKHPLSELVMSTKLSSASSHYLVIGTRDNLASALIEDNPLFTRDSEVSVSVPKQPIGTRQSGLFDLFSRDNEQAQQSAKNLVTYSAEKWGLGDALFVQQFAKPSTLAEPTPVTLFFSETPDSLYRNMVELVEPENWSELQGDFVQFRLQPESLIHFNISQPYHLGERLSPGALEYFMSTYPVRWMVIILVLIIGLAIITGRLVFRNR